ncbi:MAG: hypothetical protein JNN05_01240, partial [Candidatus Omnitrophica bacterium]|nr:hypothetical protein [Candidatus Omnitrophota bacterium]
MSSIAKSQRINQYLPVVLFVSFFLAIAIATVLLSPSWGLMDDFGLLKMSKDFWGPPIHIQAVTQNFITSGMLRPFYYSWAAVCYGIFRNWPTGFYVFIAGCNMAALVSWGLVLYRIFAIRKEDRYWTVFFYPLTFFIFTPFWNIFNYLSLQEKFVIFFAPLVFYFFHRLYQKFNARDCILMYVCLLCGLMSKATFVYVVFVLFLYSVLDLVFFHYR